MRDLDDITGAIIEAPLRMLATWAAGSWESCSGD